MAAIAAAALLAGPASAEAVLGASQTAAVYQFQPDTPSPGGSYTGGFLTANFGDGLLNYGLLQFDLSGEAGAATAAAVFLHHVYNTTDAEFGLFRLTSAWSAGSVTYNTAPTYDPTPVSTRTFTAALNGPDELEAFDVTGVVNGWLSGAYANYGLALMRIDDPDNAFLYFAAVDDGDPADGDVSVQRGPVLSVLGTRTITVGGVPEPAAWGLMILGFGLAGASLRRARRAAA